MAHTTFPSTSSPSTATSPYSYISFANSSVSSQVPFPLSRPLLPPVPCCRCLPQPRGPLSQNCDCHLLYLCHYRQSLALQFKHRHRCSKIQSSSSLGKPSLRIVGLDCCLSDQRSTRAMSASMPTCSPTTSTFVFINFCTKVPLSRYHCKEEIRTSA